MFVCREGCFVTVVMRNVCLQEGCFVTVVMSKVCLQGGWFCYCGDE